MATLTAPLESLRPLAVPSPATSTSEVKPVTISAPAPSTIDELIRLRANEPGADEAIVAYPANDIDYVYYTPRQVRIFSTVFNFALSLIAERRHSSMTWSSKSLFATRNSFHNA